MVAPQRLGASSPQILPFCADGTLDLVAVEGLIKPDDVHFPRTRLLCLENTQSGKAAGPDYFKQARSLVDKHGLALPLDGARYFNAVADIGRETHAISSYCDSVSLCLSKGLGAPAGSLLVGNSDFIRKARRWRKMVGGGMRQAGILAAGVIHALLHNRERLLEDHKEAQQIAQAAALLFPDCVEQHTNMAFVNIHDDEFARLRKHLAASGIRTSGPR